MSINQLTDNEQRILALWICHQSIKDTAECLNLTPRQVYYYRCRLKSMLGVNNVEEVNNQIKDYDALTLMGQHLLVAYEMMRVQRKLALLQT